jgi:DNA-binding NtrC family response regulator
MPDTVRTITVLIVDDERSIRELLSDTLDAVGYKSLTAEDYDSAESALKSANIDVVITDVLLPGKSGVELIKSIKHDNPNIPVLAISGKNVSQIEIKQAGADGFLAKPFRIGKIEELIEKTLAELDSAKARPAPNRKKVLVVDDEESILRTLIEALDVLGYDAIGAKNGLEALDVYEQNKVELVITDIRMPELNGIELMQRIRARDPEMPVVIITGYPLAYPPEKASTEGAAGYIAKPFRINQIDKLLGKILYNYESKEF